MSEQACTITVQITIPVAAWRVLGTTDAVRAYLVLHGLWPSNAQQTRWQVDPLSQGVVVEVHVPLPLDVGVSPHA